MPAEWEPQSGVCLTWPHEDTDWSETIDHVTPVFARIGSVISQHEPLLTLCRDDAHVAHVRQRLLDDGANRANLRFVAVVTDDTWSRDFSPLTVLVDGRPQLNSFRFNGWGGKFPATRDNAVNGQLIERGIFGDTAWAQRSLASSTLGAMSRRSRTSRRFKLQRKLDPL